jgi:hypothetical protein
MHAESIDAWVLATLCEEPGPWRPEELERDHGSPPEVRDAVARLVARGLALRMEDGFLVASAAGRYAHALVGAEE